ncbi:MAG: hypothetical protein QM650_08265 [Microlunatus sp.]
MSQPSGTPWVSPRQHGRRAVLTAVGVLLVGGLLWLLGLDVPHAAVLAATLATVVGLRRAPAVNLDQSWPDDSELRADTGVRREVARLSWSMQGYEARVQRQSVKRLHDIAAYRLGEQGLDLEDPRDYLACQLALGERAYRLISEPEERPQYADFVAAVTAVEKLTTTPPQRISGVR